MEVPAYQLPQAARLGICKERISLPSVVFVERLVVDSDSRLLNFLFTILGRILKVLNTTVLCFVQEGSKT